MLRKNSTKHAKAKGEVCKGHNKCHDRDIAAEAARSRGGREDERGGGKRGRINVTNQTFQSILLFSVFLGGGRGGRGGNREEMMWKEERKGRKIVRRKKGEEEMRGGEREEQWIESRSLRH